MSRVSMKITRATADNAPITSYIQNPLTKNTAKTLFKCYKIIENYN